MGHLCIHRVNFFSPEPTAIHSLAFDESISRLAVSRIFLPSDNKSFGEDEVEQAQQRNSRTDSCIEIWEVQKLAFLEKKIPSAFNNSVEVLAWCKGRLFSVNMHGTINEYDLTTLKCKYSIPVASGCPLYCISVNKQKNFIATGNEDGHVVLYQITTFGVEYEKKFHKQEGRILCLDWHSSGDFIVTGSIDAIRVWKVLTGQVVVRITVGRDRQNKETFVWCLAVTSDMTIISGDSRGCTSFWDGITGTLLTYFSTHKADVFALTLNKEENVVYSTGVDPLIMKFVKSEKTFASSENKWMKSVQIIEHTHDVRALQLAGKYLVSGGIDCNLVFHKYPPKTVIKFFPFTQTKYCTVAQNAEHILLRYPRFVEVWKLGTRIPGSMKGIDGEQMPLKELPKKLVKISASEDEIIICSSISADATWIAYSSLQKLRLFFIEKVGESSVPVLHKVVLPSDGPAFAYNLLFTSSNTKLIVYDKDSISIIKCDSGRSELLAKLKDDKDSTEAHLFELSQNDTYLACGYHTGKVLIYNMQELKLFCELPQYSVQPTALKFDPSTKNLVVVYSDRKIIEYNLKDQKYSNWSKNNSFTEFENKSFYPVTNIVFKKNKILLQDESFLYIMARIEQIVSNKKKMKITDSKNNYKKSETVANNKKIESSYKSIPENESDSEESEFLKVVDRYQHTSSLHSVSDSILVVEISPTDILSYLPPPLRKKKYGT